MPNLLKTFTRVLTGSIEDNPVVKVTDVTTASERGVKPLTRSVSEHVFARYEMFHPAYRDGLRSKLAELVDVRFHDEIGLYIGLYAAWIGNQNEYYVWLWRDGNMIELEQRNVREPREVDRRTLRIHNPWLY